LGAAARRCNGRLFPRVCEGQLPSTRQTFAGHAEGLADKRPSLFENAVGAPTNISAAMPGSFLSPIGKVIAQFALPSRLRIHAEVDEIIPVE
jgi:hypothetical protein